MNEPIDRMRDFMARAVESGFDVKAEPSEKVKNRYTLTASHKGSGNDYGLLGLAHHFVNRSWAADISYTYIVKNVVSLTFLGGETDSPEQADAACRWRAVGSEHDNAHALSQSKDTSKWPYLVNSYAPGKHDVYHIALYSALTRSFITIDEGRIIEGVTRYALVNDRHDQ